MEYLNDYSPFKTVATISMNRPDHTSYFVMFANKNPHYDKTEAVMSLNETRHDFELMTHCIQDYLNGSYKRIPYKTILAMVSWAVFFIRTRKSLVDKVPGVRVAKQIGLVKLSLEAFKSDLGHYKLWKEGKKDFV